MTAYAIYTTGSNYLQINNNYTKGNFDYYAFSIGPNHKVKNNVATDADGGIEAWERRILYFSTTMFGKILLIIMV